MQKDTEQKKYVPSSNTIETVLELIGGKWKLLILWILSQHMCRFSELKRQIPKISQKILI